MTVLSFGLDIAGLSGKNNSGLAALAAKHAEAKIINAWIVIPNAFSADHEGREHLDSFLPKQVSLLERMASLGQVHIDTVLESQNLDRPSNARYVWELNHRAVDYAFKGLSIYADLIGAPYAYVRRLLADSQLTLAKEVWETYPAASLREMQLPSKQYKDKHVSLVPLGIEAQLKMETELRTNETTRRDLGKKKDSLRRNTEQFKMLGKEIDVLKEEHANLTKRLNPYLVLSALHLTPTEPQLTKISGDDLDAVVAALPGVYRQAALRDSDTGRPLSDLVFRLIQKRMDLQDFTPNDRFLAPRSYVVMGKRPEIERINLRAVNQSVFDAMLDSPPKFLQGL